MIDTTYKDINVGLNKDQTVEGRVEGILSSNSPLMKAAETYGLQTANKRGLLDSSIAVGAAQGEMIKAATPIATADAGALQQQQTAKVQGDIQGNLYGTQAGYSSKLSEQEAGQKMGLEEYSQGQANERQRQELANKSTLAQMDVANREKTTLSQGVASMGQVFAEHVANIQRDPEVSTSAKTEAIASLQKAYKSNVDSLAGIYGVQIDWTPVV